MKKQTNVRTWYKGVTHACYWISDGGIPLYYPRSDTEFYGGSVFFPLYQARKYVLTSWYCNSFFLLFFCSVSRGIIFYQCPRALSEVCSPMLQNVSHVGVQGLTSASDVRTAQCVWACRGRQPAQAMYIRRSVKFGIFMRLEPCGRAARGRPAQAMYILRSVKFGIFSMWMVWSHTMSVRTCLVLLIYYCIKNEHIPTLTVFLQFT